MIKSRASPEQSSCGEASHDGAKEEEDADGGESWVLMKDTASNGAPIVRLHLLNISEFPRSNGNGIVPLRHPHAAMLG